MTPLIYNVMLLVGLGMLGAGTFLKFGLGVALIALGAVILSATLLTRWIR